MIIVKLWGGLGNQLFQYAYAYQMAQKVGEPLVLDISWYSRKNLPSPQILKLNIIYDKIWDYKQSPLFIKFLNLRIPNLLLKLLSNPSIKLGDLYYLKETRYKYSPKIEFYKKSNVYLDGYWQCPKYFSEYFPTFVWMYLPSNIPTEVRELGETLKSSLSIAIHIRRGDYPLKKPWYGRLAVLPDSYYEKALRVMQEVHSGKYYLFSDDVFLATKIAQNLVKDVEIIADKMHLNGLDEWYLMRCCQHQIIGNSTFAWWAAYLNEYSCKLVIAPNQAMGNDDIIPKQWRKINP